MPFVQRFLKELESLHALTDNAKYVVAFSGGLDSHVLLHCCYILQLPVRAVHVHHGLQDCADDWVVHCEQICQQLDVALDVIYVDAQKKSGQSPEESARIARYQALQENLNDNDCLLTAQHLNDQAETFLLQLFRTASAAGLSAMPAVRRFGGYLHCRPLLNFSREEIERYAKDNALQWVEDPTNADLSYDRNYIRNTILPALKERWPEVNAQLSTVAALQSNNLQVLEDMAAIDLANALIKLNSSTVSSRYNVISVLSVQRINKLSASRRLNLLRYWIRSAVKDGSSENVKLNKVLSRKLLLEIENSLIYSQQDANAVISLNGFEIRRFQDGLYLLALRPGVKPTGPEQIVGWNTATVLRLDAASLKLHTRMVVSSGLKKNLLADELSIRYRQGGETFHPAGRGHSQRLKKLFQEENIPPWERDSIPLLYAGDELVAVVGLWYGKGFVVAEGEEGWIVEVEVL